MNEEEIADELELRKYFESAASVEPHLYDENTAVLFRAVLKNLYQAAAIGSRDDSVVMLSVAAAVLNTDDPIGAYYHQMKILAAKQIKTKGPE